MKNAILVHIEGETEIGKIYFHRMVDFRETMLAVADMLVASTPVFVEPPMPVIKANNKYRSLKDGRVRCKFCKRIFARLRTRRTHERKYH